MGKMNVLLFLRFIAAVAYVWLLVVIPLITMIELPSQLSWLSFLNQDWVPPVLFTVGPLSVIIVLIFLGGAFNEVYGRESVGIAAAFFAATLGAFIGGMSWLFAFWHPYRVLYWMLNFAEVVELPDDIPLLILAALGVAALVQLIRLIYQMIMARQNQRRIITLLKHGTRLDGRLIGRTFTSTWISGYPSFKIRVSVSANGMIAAFQANMLAAPSRIPVVGAPLDAFVSPELLQQKSFNGPDPHKIYLRIAVGTEFETDYERFEEPDG